MRETLLPHAFSCEIEHTCIVVVTPTLTLIRGYSSDHITLAWHPNSTLA